MRLIGQLTSPDHAGVFSDFLVAQGIRHQIERDGAVWEVWISDEEQVLPAKDMLARFTQDPGAGEFEESAAEAKRVREQAARDLEQYQRRVRTGRSMFPTMRGYGVGLLTYALIISCVLMAIYSALGTRDEVLRPFLIAEPEFSIGGGMLPEVFSGQVWRLITPIFIHFGPLHLIFNLMWIYQLGSMLESRLGMARFAALVFGSAVVSNFAQYVIEQTILFGGMSGVVYALAGYAWFRGKYDPGSGVFLANESRIILLIWLVVCFTGIVGPVANTAHLFGLITGAAWGGLSAFLVQRRPQ